MEAKTTSIRRWVEVSLRAGAKVLVVQDPDERLALKDVLKGASKFSLAESLSMKTDPVPVHHVHGTYNGGAEPPLDDPVNTMLEKMRLGTPVILVITGAVELYGDNPIWCRIIREIQLAERPEKELRYSRVVFVEQPHVQVPKGFLGDCQVYQTKPPSVEELTLELEDFLRQAKLELPGNGQEKYTIASAVSGLSRHEAAPLFSRCWHEHKGTLNALWLRDQKSLRVLQKHQGAITFDKKPVIPLGGYDLLRQDVLRKKASLGSAKAAEFGLVEPKGFLLVGPSGTGKTEWARYIAHLFERPMLDFNVGKVYGGLVGQSESQMRAALECVGACSPCVVRFDEFEKAMGSGGLDGGTSERVAGTLLTWQEEHTEPVFSIATVNSVDNLKPELMRAGRFDAVYFVDLPDDEERYEILKVQLEIKKRTLPEDQIRFVSEDAREFSGAELRQIVQESLYYAYEDGARDLTIKDLMSARKKIIPNAVANKAKIDGMRAWAAQFALPASSKKTKTVKNILEQQASDDPGLDFSRSSPVL